LIVSVHCAGSDGGKTLRAWRNLGIVAKNLLGVAKPSMDELARRIGREHTLALALWQTGVHDARILAGMVDDRTQVGSAQMDRWVRGFDNWDVCDGTCCHLFVFAPPTWQKRCSGQPAARNLKNGRVCFDCLSRLAR
jgi:3-methyladenine DNA glycosylase AlkD